jgi:hypothetical protein
MRRTVFSLVVAAGVLGAALAYLREPAWLAGIESGFRSWETGPGGVRYRWTNGHASFFVPASATSLAIPAKTTFDEPGDPPVRIAISIDDRPADRFVLHDDQWQTRKIRMPAPGNRGLRRIDVRVDRLRSGNRGAQIGEIVVAGAANR